MSKQNSRKNLQARKRRRHKLELPSIVMKQVLERLKIVGFKLEQELKS